MENKHVLSAGQFSKKDVTKLIDLADLLLPYSGISSKLIKGPYDSQRAEELKKIFRDYRLCTVFFGEGNSSASTRTRMSFHDAMYRLGGDWEDFDEDRSSIKKLESPERTLKNLQHYFDMLVIRDQESGAVDKFASILERPVINAGDGSNEHPTQFLMDAYFLHKFFGRINGLKVAFVGGMGRVVNSNVKGLENFDVKILGIPAVGCELPEKFRTKAYQEAPFEKYLEVLNDFKPDAIYLSRVQTNVGASGKFSLSPDDIPKLPPKAIWMHAQPAIDSEIPYVLDSDPRAKWYEQAAYGVPMRMSLIAEKLGHADDVMWLFR